MWNWIKKKTGKREDQSIPTDKPSLVIEFGGERLDSFRIYSILPEECSEWDDDQINNLTLGMTSLSSPDIHDRLAQIGEMMLKGNPAQQKVGESLVWRANLSRRMNSRPVVTAWDVFRRIFRD